jgi:hypothetical protein
VTLHTGSMATFAQLVKTHMATPQIPDNMATSAQPVKTHTATPQISRIAGNAQQLFWTVVFI